MPSLSPFTGSLGRENAAHLLRRITFGATREKIDYYANKTVDNALNDFFKDVATPSPPIDPKTGKTWLNPKQNPDINSEGFLLNKYYVAWHLEQIRKSGVSAKEKLVYFYHTYMPVQQSIVRDSAEVYYQNTLYRYYAFGNFKSLMNKICIDNAMLTYIDNNINEAGSPNENFARELMELYTIGKGKLIADGDYTNYTEDDVKEAAKVLSGYKNDKEFKTIDSDTNIPRGYVKVNSTNQAYLHNSETKKFSSKFANTEIKPNKLVDQYATKEAVLDELDQLINMIFDQTETSKFLCRRIYRQFVYHKITTEIETDIITPLAATFKNNNYEIKPVLEQLLKSQHFYDLDNAITTDNHIGALIKSPIDLVIGTLNFFKIQLPSDTNKLYSVYSDSILKAIQEQDMNFYEPIDVAGYPPYHQYPTYNRYWISAGTIGYRYKFAASLVKGEYIDSNGDGVKLDIVDYVKNNVSDPSNSTTIVQELINYIFPVSVEQDRFDYFEGILLDKLSKTNWATEWQKYINTNSDLAIRNQLESLIISLMQSPEYQLF